MTQENVQDELLAEDFLRFLSATREDSSCPGCGRSPSKWGLLTSGWKGNDATEVYMEEMFHRFRKVREDGKPYGITTYGMYCVHCGHVEHVYRAVVRDWLKTEPENEA